MKGIAIALVMLAGMAFGAYIINDIPVDTPPKPNYSRVVSMHLDFHPVLTTCVRSEYQLVTNVTVAIPTYATNVSTVVTNVATGATNELGEDIVVQVTNEVSEVTVGSTNVLQQQVLYAYPPNDRHISPDQTKQLSMVTMQQLGISSNSTVEQVMDAMIKAGMAAVGIDCGGGELLDN